MTTSLIKSTRNTPWKGVTGGGNFGQRFLFGLFRILDVRVGYFFVALTVPFYMLINRSNYKAIRSYLRMRCGQSPWRSFWGTWRNHYVFGQMMMDRFAIFSGQKDRFTVTNPDAALFQHRIESPQGFMIAGTHAGNFEIAGYLLHQEKKRIHSVIFGGENAGLQANRAHVLAQNSVEMIPVQDDMSHLFAIKAALDNGQIVSMPCDRLFGSPRYVTCTFMGAPARFPLGPFLLAAQLDVPMLVLLAMKERRAHYHIYVKEIQVDRAAFKGSKNTAAALAQQYAFEVEKVLKQYPEQWFNFYNFWENA